VLENNYRGILSDGASLVNIEGNTVIGTGARAGLNTGRDGDGITCGAAAGATVSSCSITANVVTRSAGIGIRLQRGSLMIVANNVVTESGQAGISLLAVDDSQVRGNTVSRSSLESARSHDDIHVGAVAQRNLVVFNQCPYGGAARASIYVAPTSTHTLVAENSLLGGAGFANLSATTSINWDGSSASWNR
jgi:parallel beta-helix repeat protein